jgi:formylglycine-generating enzyme required for sulfatase activity
MTFRLNLAAAVALLASHCPAIAADPVVSNLTASQRAGTKLVDITYDVTASTPTVKVTLEVSSDGGTTYSVPVTAVSGAVGASVAVGSSKTITWNAGVDWDRKFSAQTRFRVVADDLKIEGFSMIPAGAFTMGRNSGDSDILDATPVTVTVTAFYMAQHEVTKELWDEVRTWASANGYSDLATGEAKAANHPVHSITWFDMVKWCNARSQLHNLNPVYTVSGAVMRIGTTPPVADWNANGYRLPTEAEWEKAARGGVSGKRFPWGTDTISHSQANYPTSNIYYDTSASGLLNNFHPDYAIGSHPYTSPVGSFRSNEYGLYDMCGNVWEWCWDWYGSTIYANGVTSPLGATSGSLRVIRGGSWRNIAEACRVAYRYHDYPTNSFDTYGFRAARSSVQKGSTGTGVTSSSPLETRDWMLRTSSPLDGSISGAGSYLSGTNATLTATPSAGYLFGS